MHTCDHCPAAWIWKLGLLGHMVLPGAKLLRPLPLLSFVFLTRVLCFWVQLATLEAAISFLMQHLPPELTPPASSHQDTSGIAALSEECQIDVALNTFVFSMVVSRRLKPVSICLQISCWDGISF